MATDIGETVRVGAVFSGAAVQPRWFDWQQRRYDITTVTYRWQSRMGEALLAHFAVSAGGNLYELSFNRQTLQWRLEKAIPSS